MRCDRRCSPDGFRQGGYLGGHLGELLRKKKLLMLGTHQCGLEIFVLLLDVGFFAFKLLDFLSLTLA